jgi:hypothetical protein
LCFLLLTVFLERDLDLVAIKYPLKKEKPRLNTLFNHLLLSYNIVIY